MESVQVDASEDGKGAIIIVLTDDGRMLYSGFDFPFVINSDIFESALYVEEFNNYGSLQ